MAVEICIYYLIFACFARLCPRTEHVRIIKDICPPYKLQPTLTTPRFSICFGVVYEYALSGYCSPAFR